MQKTQLLRFPLHTRFPPGDLQRQRACWGSQRRQRLVWRVALGGSGALPVALHATFTLLPGGLSLQDTTALAGRRGLSAPAGCGGWQVLSRGQCVSSVEACAGPWPTSCVRLSAPASVWGRVGGGLVTARRDWGLAMPLARRRPGSEGASGAACSAVLCVREVFLSVLRLHLCSPGFH